MNKLFWVALTVFVSVAAAGCRAVPCEAHSDCYSTEYCASDGYCADDPLYESCFDGLDCSSSLTLSCVNVTTTGGTNGSFCSAGCSPSDACPSGRSGMGTGCYAPGIDSVFVCFELCTFSSDCEFGSSCYEVLRTDGLLDYICIPD